MSEEAAKPPRPDRKKFQVPANYRELVQKHIEEKVPQGRCPACGTNRWSLVDEPAVIILSAQVDKFGAMRLPAAITSCGNCGYVRMFALGSIAGLTVKDLESEG